MRSAVRRLARYGSESRASDLHALDTFALEEVLAALAPPSDAAEVEQARALVEIAAHATARDDVIAHGADVAAARACVERWRAFWSVYGADFVVLAGPSRLAAMVLETRYRKWAVGALTRRLGLDADGRPVVIGPDGPTVGGYPLLGVLRACSFARLARTPPGVRVTLVVR